MKLGRYVIVYDGGNYVALRAERSHNYCLKRVSTNKIFPTTHKLASFMVESRCFTLFTLPALHEIWLLHHIL